MQRLALAAQRGAPENKPQGWRVFSIWIQWEGEENFHVWGCKDCEWAVPVHRRGARRCKSVVPAFFPAVESRYVLNFRRVDCNAIYHRCHGSLKRNNPLKSSPVRLVSDYYAVVPEDGSMYSYSIIIMVMKIIM